MVFKKKIIYYNPEEIGESVMGEVDRIEEDKYSNERIVLSFNPVPGGDWTEIILPAHKSLMDQCENVHEGDHLYITLTDFKYIPEHKVNMKIYNVKRTPFAVYQQLRNTR